jgi:predicted nucleotidyltransferase
VDSGFVPSPVATEEKLRHPEFVRFARHDLVDKLAKSLAGRREICEAYLFGSQALGTAQDHSDVDVAVYVDPVTDLNRGFGIDAEIATDLRDFPETNYSTAWWGWMSMN